MGVLVGAKLINSADGGDQQRAIRLYYAIMARLDTVFSAYLS